jgi:hypothetical protein
MLPFGLGAHDKTLTRIRGEAENSGLRLLLVHFYAQGSIAIGYVQAGHYSLRCWWIERPNESYGSCCVTSSTPTLGYLACAIGCL